MWLLTQVAPPDGGKPIMIRVPPGKHGVGRKDQPVLVEDKSVSRNHGWVRCDADRFWVGDGGSKYGTKVNTIKVESSEGEAEATEGAVIRWGGQESGVADYCLSRDRFVVVATRCGADDATADISRRAAALGFAVAKEPWDAATAPTHCVTRAGEPGVEAASVACLRPRSASRSCRPRGSTRGRRGSISGKRRRTRRRTRPRASTSSNA